MVRPIIQALRIPAGFPAPRKDPLMAMEERQRQIREGAGLEESRLNTEFIEMMKKWGPHLMMGLAILAGLYVLYTKYEEYTARKADTAWADLDAAEVAASPDVLVQLAADHS